MNGTLDPSGSPRRSFATTRWSLVLAAAGRMDDEPPPDVAAALGELCELYWMPLYGYARRRNLSPEDAADATQAFFTRLLARNELERADRERGRFRAFLLTAFHHFLLNEHDHRQAAKRGGRVSIHSLEISAAENRLACEPSHELTPERLFARSWAITLLEHVLQLLRQEYHEKNRSRFFELCRHCLTGSEPPLRYADIARECDMTESAVKVAIHRLRTRYRELLLQEVAQTVQNSEDAEHELRALFEAVRT